MGWVNKWINTNVVYTVINFDHIDNLSLTSTLRVHVHSQEAFDYIGSSRMVYEMMKGAFPTPLEDGTPTPHPINISHINSFIEISQVGLPQNGKLWLHTDPVCQRKPAIKSKVL